MAVQGWIKLTVLIYVYKIQQTGQRIIPFPASRLCRRKRILSKEGIPKDYRRKRENTSTLKFWRLSQTQLSWELSRELIRIWMTRQSFPIGHLLREVVISSNCLVRKPYQNATGQIWSAGAQGTSCQEAMHLFDHLHIPPTRVADVTLALLATMLKRSYVFPFLCSYPHACINWWSRCITFFKLMPISRTNAPLLQASKQPWGWIVNEDFNLLIKSRMPS